MPTPFAKQCCDFICFAHRFIAFIGTNSGRHNGPSWLTRVSCGDTATAFAGSLIQTTSLVLLCATMSCSHVIHRNPVFYFSFRVQAQKALNVFHSAMTKFQHALDWFQDTFQKVPGPMQASRPGTPLVCAAMSTGRHLNAGCPCRCLPFRAWRCLAR